jgi:hypothetical protein
MFRRGQWVVHEGRVGIHVKADGVLAEVHLVNEEGATVLITTVEAMSLREAAFDEIPLKRRPSVQLAAALGIAGTPQTAADRARATRAHQIVTAPPLRGNAITRFLRSLRGG